MGLHLTVLLISIVKRADLCKMPLNQILYCFHIYYIETIESALIYVCEIVLELDFYHQTHCTKGKYNSYITEFDRTTGKILLHGI